MEQGQCTSERNLPWIRKNGHVKFLKSSLSLPFSPSFPTRNEKLLADPERLRQISERIPAGRWGEPADFVGPVVFLASNASQYVCGELLVVDGVRYRFFWCSPLSSSPCLLRLSTSLFFFFSPPFFRLIPPLRFEFRFSNSLFGTEKNDNALWEISPPSLPLHDLVRQKRTKTDWFFSLDFSSFPRLTFTVWAIRHRICYFNSPPVLLFWTLSMCIVVTIFCAFFPFPLIELSNKPPLFSIFYRVGWVDDIFQKRLHIIPLEKHMDSKLVTDFCGL